GGGPRRRVALLVHVAVDDVELALRRLQGPYGVVDDEPARSPEPSTGEERLRLASVLGVGVGQEDLTTGATGATGATGGAGDDGPGEPVGGETEARAHLEDSPGPHGPGEQLQGRAHDPAHDRELP